MSGRIAYVNGRFAPIGEAVVSVEDRGYQFADGVYEVWLARDGRLLDMDAHLARLSRSLRELEISAPMSETSLRAVLSETLRRNKAKDAIVYLQVTRGVAPRNHPFPKPAVAPSIVITVKRVDARALWAQGEKGVKVISAPDLRWKRCDIKTVALLSNVLAKQQAAEQGAQEAWLIDERGDVTEGSSSTAWIVDASGVLRTRALSNEILPGVVRARVLELARALQIKVEESSFTLQQAKEAREALLTSATNGPVGIVDIDGTAIGDGAPGAITKRLRDAYFGA